MGKSIFKAIEEARAIKENARIKAKEAVERANNLCSEDIERVEAEHREKARAALSKAEKEANELGENIRRDLVRRAEQQCLDAGQFVEDAVRYLVEKVRGI